MQPPLLDSEITVIETIGDLIDFWGFSKHHGRIWALLYLREEPCSSPDIQQLLEMSAGLVSMSLKELLHWDVVEKVWVKGDRKDYYVANTDLWHMMSRVIREREQNLIQSCIRNLDDALGDLETTESDERIAYMKPRVQHLLSLSESFAAFLNFLLNNAEANIGDLQRDMARGPAEDETK